MKRLLFLGSSCIYPRLAPSRSRRAASSRESWKRPTSPTPSQRSPGSRCANRTTASTGPLPVRHADEPVRAERQFRPGKLPRPSRPESGDSTRRRNPGRTPSRSGDGKSEEGIPPRGRHGRGRLFPHGSLRRRPGRGILQEPPALLHQHRTGTDIAIGELAALIGEIVGFRGEIRFDDTKPDGTPRKLLDVSRLRRLGWEAKIGLREGIERTYRWFLENRRANGGPRKGRNADEPVLPAHPGNRGADSSVPTFAKGSSGTDTTSCAWTTSSRGAGRTSCPSSRTPGSNRSATTSPCPLRRVDRVYNLACPASPVHYQYNAIKTIKTNVMGAINTLGIAKRVRARILQASTSRSTETRKSTRRTRTTGGG